MRLLGLLAAGVAADPRSTAAFALEPGDGIVLLSRPFLRGVELAPELAARVVAAAAPEDAAEQLADASHATDAPYSAIAVLRCDA